MLFPRVAVWLLRFVFMNIDEGYFAVGVHQNPDIGCQGGDPCHLFGHGKNP